MAVRLSALLASHALPSERSSGTHFCLKLSKLQSHGAAGWFRKTEKNQMISSGLEPATFRLVAKCLNQLRYRIHAPNME
jgi:hypothetical protein